MGAGPLKSHEMLARHARSYQNRSHGDRDRDRECQNEYNFRLFVKFSNGTKSGGEENVKKFIGDLAKF